MSTESLAALHHRPCTSRPAGTGLMVNDLHSRLNATRVSDLVRPRTRAELATIVARRAGQGRSLAVSGGRGAMGGQAFASGETLLDLRSLDRVLEFDAERGRMWVEAGIQWPALMRATAAAHVPGLPRWGVAQKQTGADQLTLGGTVAVNAHGRGLTLPPFGGQVESLEIVDAAGRVQRVSRTQHPELFSLVLGGYGLFGVVTAVELRLVPRVKVRRKVEVRSTAGLMQAFDERVAAGFTYGDFQVAIDPARDDFLQKGVFSCYEPVDEATPLEAARTLSDADWRGLLGLAHTAPTQAFERYAAHYLATDGQVYWSDTHQLAGYVRDYHAEIDQNRRAAHPGSEMITELYVPRANFEPFLHDLRACLRERRAQLVYGTLRLIERDEDSFLAWAREPWICTVLNLHVDHTVPGLAQAAGQFRAVIDVALAHGGSFYLTYHRWATAAQLRAAHPRIDAFLAAKQRLDPEGRFQSDWLQHLLRQLAHG